MDENVKIIASHPTQVLHGYNFQLSLEKREDINIQKKGVTLKCAHFDRDGVHVTLSELCQPISTSSSVLPDKSHFLNTLIPENCKLSCTTFISILSEMFRIY